MKGLQPTCILMGMIPSEVRALSITNNTLIRMKWELCLTSYTLLVVRSKVQALFISVMYGIIFVLLYNLEICCEEQGIVSLSALKADPSL